MGMYICRYIPPLLQGCQIDLGTSNPNRENILYICIYIKICGIQTVYIGMYIHRYIPPLLQGCQIVLGTTNQNGENLLGKNKMFQSIGLLESLDIINVIFQLVFDLHKQYTVLVLCDNVENQVIC
jgi:hypothetical protein